MNKLVHVIDNLGLGGAEVLLFSTIKKLPSFEHHIIILDQKIQIEGVSKVATIHCMNHTGWHRIFRTCNKMRKLVAKLNPELVHSHLFLSSFLARLALGKKYAFVYSIHSIYSASVFKKIQFRWMEKLIYNDHHRLIAVSKYVLEDYKKVVTKCRHGYVLYNFIDDAFINDPTRKKYPSASLKKWVAVGSLKPPKNVEKLIFLFADLYNHATDTAGLCLDIYGEGRQRNRLEEMIKELNLPVYLRGNSKNIVNILGDYDAYISSSKYEGYGIAPMEALAKGLPLFLSDIPVFKEIYKDNAFYFPINNNDSLEFLKACEKYNSMTPDEKMSLFNNGIDFAKTTSNSYRYIADLLYIYKNSSTKDN